MRPAVISRLTRSPPTRMRAFWRARYGDLAMQVDWFKVISDIERAGMTHKEIAHHMDASRTSICNWKAGAEPRYGDGAMLIELWGLLTHRNPNELPYIRWNCERYRKR